MWATLHAPLLQWTTLLFYYDSTSSPWCSEQHCCSISEQQCCSSGTTLMFHTNNQLKFQLSLICFSSVECHPPAMHQSNACNRHACKDGTCFLHSNSSKLDSWCPLCTLDQRRHYYIHLCSIWMANLVFFVCSLSKNMSGRPKAHMQTLCCVGMHRHQQSAWVLWRHWHAVVLNQNMIQQNNEIMS